jgi:uncharacterized protein (DUF1499 family)
MIKVTPWLLAFALAPVHAATLEGRVSVGAQTVTAETFFKTLKRPDSPNHWLVAPADFALKPDAVAPVFAAPMSVLRETFKTVVARSDGTSVTEDSGAGLHVVATTRWLRFQDDVRVLFIPLPDNHSTLAAYSASRVGYWDLGANRRRLEDWIQQTQQALANTKR